MGEGGCCLCFVVNGSLQTTTDRQQKRQMDDDNERRGEGGVEAESIVKTDDGQTEA